MGSSLFRRLLLRSREELTRALSGGRYERTWEGRRTVAARRVPADVASILENGIENSFNRISVYAQLAARLNDVNLGHVVEFGGSNEAIAKILSYDRWSVAPNYPVVDLCNLSQYESGAIDTVVLDNILEHVSDTDRALAECARVLKPGGRLLLLLPFLLPVHGAPFDYFRWTPDGLRMVLSRKFAKVEVGSWGNQDAVRLMMDHGSPDRGWPTYEHACERLGEARARFLLEWDEPAWCVSLWAVATL